MRKLNKKLYLNRLRAVVLLTVAFSLLGITQSYAQQRVVTGTVTSKSGGEAIIGATVMVEGTSNGTFSDLNGKFSISVPSDNAVISVSYVGYVSQKIAVGNQTNIVVELENDVVNLEQVVVIGYGTQKQRDLTGAIAVVKGNDIAKIAPSTLDQALQGMASGVQVTSNDGTPGGGVAVRIRGTGSIVNKTRYML